MHFRKNDFEKMAHIAPIVGAGLIAGGAGLAAGFMQSRAQESANDTNRHIAEQNRHWQENMSNSAHQRAVKDLKAAGLNPILSANNGASTPAGSTTTVQPVDGMAEGLKAGLVTALDAVRLKKEIKAVDSQGKLNEAQAAAAIANSHAAASTAKRQEAETKVINATLPTVIQKAVFEQDQIKQDRKYMEYDNLMKRVNPATSAIKDIGLGAAGALHGLRGGSMRINPKTTGTFNKKTGEIHNP